MNKMRRIVIMMLLILSLMIINVTYALASENSEDTNYHLIDECTGEYLDYEEAESNGIALFTTNDSKYHVQDNEVEHVIESLYDEEGNSYVNSSINAPATLPSSVDLTGAFLNSETNESYTPFPPIASQGGLGSCVCFAGTYYQYTYEVNQLNRINSIGDGNLYSTAYVYNYINHGGTGAIGTGDLYDFLMERGCVKLSMFPYYSEKTEENLTRWLPNGDSEIAAMREALNTRISSWYFYHKRNNEADGDKINGPNSPILTDMKTLLAQGKVLVGGMSTGWQDEGYDTTLGFDPKYVREAEYDTVIYNGEKIICQTRSGVGAGAHQVTIVGYDDSIWVDLNEDGSIQNGERGAFKIINSWGADADLATFWVLYDALNPTSSVPHDDSWISLGEQRTSVFGAKYDGVHYNRCFFINVENKKVDVVAELQYYLTRRSSANITFGMEITKDDGSKETYSKTILPRSNGNLPLAETYLYDISSIGSSFNYLSNLTKWTATVVVNEDESLTEEEQAKMSEVTFKITDNTGRVLNEYPTYFNAFSGTRSFSLETDFMDRDINFDKEITVQDYNAIRNYVRGYGGLSYLQQKFADLDGDGAVTQTDLDAYYSWYSQL